MLVLRHVEVTFGNAVLSLGLADLDSVLEIIESFDVDSAPDAFPGRREFLIRTQHDDAAFAFKEKQKLRLNYGISERQLRRYFERAAHQGGPTGENLLSLLERRLDSVVFRLGFAPTIPAARQLVAHGHVRVNGGRVDRSGYEVAPGDGIALSERGRKIPDVIQAVEHGPEIRLPSFLALDPSDPFAGRVVAVPARGVVPFVVDEAAIVEFYAR